MIGIVAVNVMLTLLISGWAVWVALDPQFWFPAAFAEQGEPGEQGPPGERGPEGPPGPFGPGVDDVAVQAEDATGVADEAIGLADDLEGRVAELESINLFDLENRLSAAESRIDEACSTLSFDLDTYGC